jgi:endoplasmic reticulum vesicle transporter
MVVDSDYPLARLMPRPGVFFSYEISPILVAHRESRQSFAHFLTSYVLFYTPLGWTSA